MFFLFCVLLTAGHYSVCRSTRLCRIVSINTKFTGPNIMIRLRFDMGSCIVIGCGILLSWSSNWTFIDSFETSMQLYTKGNLFGSTLMTTPIWWSGVLVFLCPVYRARVWIKWLLGESTSWTDCSFHWALVMSLIDDTGRCSVWRWSLMRNKTLILIIIIKLICVS